MRYIMFILAALFHISTGAVYRVQWSVGNVDYIGWASSNSFHPGDTLVFEYHPQFHNVMQVKPSDFKSCNSTTPPLVVYTSGNDAVTFKRNGNYYFICGTPSHCEAGQKVEIKVVPSSMRNTSRSAMTPSAFSPVPPPTSSVDDTNDVASDFPPSRIIIIALPALLLLMGATSRAGAAAAACRRF